MRMILKTKLEQLIILKHDELETGLYFVLAFFLLFVSAVEADEDEGPLLDPAGNQAGDLHFPC